MPRSLALVFVGLIAVSCSSDIPPERTTGTDSTATTMTTGSTGPTAPTGSTGPTTGDATAVVTGSTDATTSDTTTVVTTGATDATSSTTGPSTATDISGGDGTTNGGPAPTFDCGGLPAGVVGVDYSALLEASGGMGGPYEWALGLNDELPPGLALVPSPEESAFAEIAGIPTEAGSFTFTIVLTSNATEEPGERQCELEIAAAATPGQPR